VRPDFVFPPIALHMAQTESTKGALRDLRLRKR
jgi:hypothetical protein